MLDVMEHSAAHTIDTPAGIRAPFTINRLKALRAPEPKLWGEADLSPVGDTLLDWYWHGTPASNIPSILEHGLLPARTKSYKRTCLAARSHVAHFWARVQIYGENVGEDIALIRIPGSALVASQLFIEKGTLRCGPYGEYRPDVRHAWKKQRWADTNWQGFQAAFGSISTDQILRVEPEMIVRARVGGKQTILPTLLAEMNAGEPPKVDPNLV
jgi:hypothetical protein